MEDATFKACDHQFGNGDKITSRGEEVSNGYKPDVTVKDAKENLLYILECEQKTDRKAFLGDFIKAEFHAERERKKQNPELIIVMQKFKNTTTQQIAAHLCPYIKWLKSKKGGQLSLSAVQVLSDKDYQQSISAGEILGSEAFKKRGHILCKLSALSPE